MLSRFPLVRSRQVVVCGGCDHQVVGKSSDQHGCWKVCGFQRPLLSRLQRHGRVVGTVSASGGHVLSDRLLNLRRTKHEQGNVCHNMCAQGWPGCGARRETECSHRAMSTAVGGSRHQMHRKHWHTFLFLVDHFLATGLTTLH